MSTTVIAFLCGMIFGGIVGFFIMGLLVMARDHY